MSEQKPKRLYCGNGRIITSGNGRKFQVLKLNVDKINAAMPEHGFKGDHGNYLSVKVWPNRGGKDKFGNDYSVEIDTWKPNTEEQGNVGFPAAGEEKQPPTPPQPTADGPIDDIPW